MNGVRHHPKSLQKQTFPFRKERLARRIGSSGKKNERERRDKEEELI